MKINVLLCDDDKDFLQRLTETVTKQPRPAGTSIAITRNLHSASLSDRDLSRYQIMFLDIDMAERSGMDIARRVRALHLDTIIIFVTNYPQFSLEGYEVRAFRYLLKQKWNKNCLCISAMLWPRFRMGRKGCDFLSMPNPTMYRIAILYTWAAING